MTLSAFSFEMQRFPLVEYLSVSIWFLLKTPQRKTTDTVFSLNFFRERPSLLIKGGLWLHSIKILKVEQLQKWRPMSYNCTTFLVIFVGTVFIVVELKLRHPKNKMNHIERGHS